jgi:hypothetical protein
VVAAMPEPRCGRHHLGHQFVERIVLSATAEKRKERMRRAERQLVVDA